MSLAVGGLWVSCLWLVIYAVKYSTRRPKSLLPFSQSRRPSTEVSLKNLKIRVKTEVFNAFHDELSTRLSSKPSAMLRQTLLRLYDLGSLISVIGMLAAFCLLLSTTVTLSLDVLRTRHVSHQNTSVVARRGVHRDEDTFSSNAPGHNAFTIHPIIPGVTVPFSHLPLILLALGVSQIIHEAGHAITAALHRIPMLASGVSITLIFPSAFVILPSARLENLLPRDRMQVLAGGCFHNFAFLCLLLLAAWSGIGPVFASLLFQDVSALGQVIVSIDYDSPLIAHLPIGTLITKMDDVRMGSTAQTTTENPWDDYLLSPASPPTHGWCVDQYSLSEVSECIAVGLQSCFISKEDAAVQYSMSPAPILTESAIRCNSSTECAPAASCVVPRSDQQLVRITVAWDYAGSSGEDIVVWKGPKREIWEQVEVGNLRPRFSFISRKLPSVVSHFFEYMKLANLSLYLVNMLPLTVLDGYRVLVALLELLCVRASAGLGSVDLEALNNRSWSPHDSRAQRACRTFLNTSTFVLVTSCALLGILRWLDN
ncbi:hypothetical protein PAXRUDRAFT_145793 [Paxillus rubicundulus Ve08.2h10]|uniref:Endopeptidase S2P n=1 Tax=Paxillus rubicundulus Ve08.2h10 TaxID=930991 RepID=A0A0D0DUY8_9AGAM|nr:hypothetical protein PAXRUDRAFT_145793 [Paxillus rubicundulus Ve08.2h10]